MAEDLADVADVNSLLFTVLNEVDLYTVAMLNIFLDYYLL
jgi:hypothetical protein